MTFYRAHVDKLGGHFHVRLFVAERENVTYAGIGELCMSFPEWADMKRRLNIKVTGGNQHEPDIEPRAPDPTTTQDEGC